MPRSPPQPEDFGREHGVGSSRCPLLIGNKAPRIITPPKQAKLSDRRQFAVYRSEPAGRLAAQPSTEQALPSERTAATVMHGDITIKAAQPVQLSAIGMSQIVLELQECLHLRGQNARKSLSHGAVVMPSHVVDGWLSECNGRWS